MEVIVTAGVAALMVIEKAVGPTDWGVGLHESATVTLMVLVAAEAGVPERRPDVEKVRPVGTPVALQVTAPVPPDLLNWNE